MSVQTIDYLRNLEAFPNQPLGVARNGGQWPEPRYMFSLAVCARWETQ